MTPWITSWRDGGSLNRSRLGSGHCWLGAASNRLEEMIRIITIEREYGSGAREIARELARRLDWKLWDERLTEEIARLSHSGQSDVRRREERRDPLYYRLFKSFALGSWEGSPNASSVEMLDADSIVQLSERAVQQAAAEGNCVIVGRGSQHFLRDRSDTLRFFLYRKKAKSRRWRQTPIRRRWQLTILLPWRDKWVTTCKSVAV